MFVSVLGLMAVFSTATPTYAASPKLADAVVSLSTSKSSFGPSDDVMVHVVLTNPNPEALHVLSYLVPTDGLEAPLFSVTVDGVPAPYLGLVAKRRAPTEQDYLTLSAGQSVGFDVNLSQYYSFASSGDYRISYQMQSSEAYAVDSAKRAAGWVQSNAVTVFAGGRADRKIAVREPDAVSGPTTFTSCAADRQTLLTTARNNASVYANESATYFGNNRNGPRYVKWFGTYVADRWNTVKNHYDLIRTAVDTATVDFDCTCTIANGDSVFAYVFPSQPYRIHLCGAFWSAPATGTDSKAGTVIHEMSHFTILGGTSDFVYGQTNAMALAISNPSQAIMNADSHEYFAENTPATPDDSGGGTPTVLQNGVATGALTGAAGSETRFTVSIPTGATNLVIRTSGGSGDPDLYVRFGSQPSTTVFDCKSEAVGPTEQCVFAAPSAGTYHVMVLGFTAYAGMSLTASWQLPATPQLQNGVTVSGLSGALNSTLSYTIAIPAGASNLVVRTSGGSGDPDLYVRFGSAPTTTTYDCRSFSDGPTEQCSFATTSAGTYYVLINGFAAFSGLSLTATWTVGGGGGSVDEPGFAAFPLPIPAAFPNCPAGYFTATIEDGPGAGLTPGLFGLALELAPPGTQRLEGGLNFGGLVDGSQAAFAGFAFQNPANELQTITLTMLGSPTSNRNGSLPVRVKIIRQAPNVADVLVLETTATLTMAQSVVRSINLIPAYYVVTVTPEGAAAVSGGAADGEVFIGLNTQFVNRPGGGFFAGVVFGGYHAFNPFGPVSGFGAICIGTQHSASARVLSAPTFGATGARDLRLRLKDYNQQDVIVVPQ